MAPVEAIQPKPLFAEKKVYNAIGISLVVSLWWLVFFPSNVFAFLFCTVLFFGWTIFIFGRAAAYLEDHFFSKKEDKEEECKYFDVPFYKALCALVASWGFAVSYPTFQDQGKGDFIHRATMILTFLMFGYLTWRWIEKHFR